MDNRASQCKGVDERKVVIDNPPVSVSIITPVLNGIKYLEACIQSVLNQSYPYIEHVFVDGGSADGTLDMLTSYKARYPGRIRFISEPDKSAGEAWNKGLKMARGDIFGWLGADDTYEPDAVLTVVEFFSSNLGAFFVFGDANVIDERNGTIKRVKAKDFDLEEAINGYLDIVTTSVFYRREVVEKVGLMDTRETGVERDYWIRAGKVFKLYRIEKVLSNFRLRKDSGSGRKEAFRIYSREGYIVSRRHGGGIFSIYGVRYFGTPIIELLQPVLGRYYPFIHLRLVYPFVRWLGKTIKI